MAVFPLRKSRSSGEVTELHLILSRCRELLTTSDDSIWSCLDVCAILLSVDAGLAALSTDSPIDVTELTLLFLPTGPLQETSMSNTWSDEYLTLSERFDVVISKWK